MQRRTLVQPVKPAWKEFEMDPDPVEDGMQQADHIIDLAVVLREHFRNQADVFVSAGGFVFYDPDNKNRRVAPDCYIALGVDVEYIRTMPNYLVWEVGKPPDFVIEVASASTAQNDLGGKRDLYARLGITEYWRFDPTGGELYGQPLTGEGLVAGVYQPFQLQTDAAGLEWAHSRVLNLDFYWYPDQQDQQFRIRDSRTGEWLHTLNWEKEARQAAEARQLEAEERGRISESERAEAEERGRISAAEVLRLKAILEEQGIRYE